ncbi:SMI1/KNR4 family protein OS=Lysinibacillus sphaericus OX=1421 GN=LS41612_13385 PE=4 SV=1 [Lysinibacillus sphaericus]
MFLKKNSDLNVFYQDFGALSLPFYTLDTDLFRWLENDAVIKDDDFTFDEPDLIEEVKVYIVRKPNEANKFIMELRKCFNLNLSINDIREKLNSLPFLVIQDIKIMKYGKTIEILNQKYNCIEVRNSKNVILISPEKN